MGRLVATGVGKWRPTAATARSPEGGDVVAVLVASFFARPDRGAASAGTREQPSADAGGSPASVVARLGRLAPADASVLAALSIGLILLAVTALALYALARGHAASHRGRSPLHGARAALHDPNRRSDVVAVLVLVVASLAVWTAVTLWLLTRAG